MIAAIVGALKGFTAASGAAGATAGSAGGAVAKTAASGGALGPGAMSQLATASPGASKLPTATPVASPIPAVPRSQLAAEQAGGAFRQMNGALDAVNGPMKMFDKSLGVVADTVGKASDTAVDFATKPLQVVDKGFKVVTDTVSKAGTVAVDYATKPLDLMTKGLNALNGPALKAVGTLSAFRDSVTAFGNSIAGFVQLANPAIVQRFTFASQDLTASIGKALIPAMQFATRFTRSFADVVFALSGPFQRLANVVFKPLGEAADTVLAALSPVVRMFGRMVDAAGAILKPFMTLGSALFKLAALPFEGLFSGLETAFTPAITAIAALGVILGEMATSAANIIDGVIQRARSFFGITNKSVAGASVGAAVRNVGMGSVESFQSKAMTQAFSLGTASAEDRTAKGVEEMASAIKRLPAEIWEKMKVLPAEIAQKLWVEIQKALPDPGAAVDRAVDAVTPDFGTAGRDAGRWLERQKDAANRALDDPFGAVGRLFGR